MLSSKYICLLLCILNLYQNALAAMTEKQMAATMKLIRNTCTNKIGIDPAKVDAHHTGVFDFGDKDSMCYLHCVLMTYTLMKKDNSFDVDAGIALIKEKAPPSVATTAAASIGKCRDAVKTKDHKCKAAMEIAKCIYEADPQNYFIP